MYKLKNGLCGTVVHILLSYPILCVALGVGGAAYLVKSYIRESPPPYTVEVTAKKVMEDPRFCAKVQEAEQVPGARELTDEAEKIFRAIIQVESGGRRIGVHPDGVSYGPAGLTLPALKDVHRLVCNSSEKLDYRAILNDPEESVKFAKLYFLEMVHRFKDVKIAATAYHYGPTRVARLLKKHKPLPTGYWRKVERAMIN
jgi:hypothetical protein